MASSPAGRLRWLALGLIVVLLLVSTASVRVVPPPGVPGSSQLSSANDAAIYSNVTWTNLTTSVTGFPPLTFDFDVGTGAGTLAFDAQDDYALYLYAQVGAGTPPGTLRDIVYRAGQWTNLTGTTPVGSAASPSSILMEYDPALDGIVCIPLGASIPWFFQDGVWSELDTTGYDSSTIADSSMMTYDSTDGYLLVSNGNQTWSLASNLVWSSVANFPQDLSLSEGAQNPAPNEVAPMMTYDAHDGYVLAIDDGGYSFAYSHGTWSNLSANGTVTPSEFEVGEDGGNTSAGQSFVYDPQFGSVVMFGGACDPDESRCAYDATWAYQAGNWTNITGSTAPSPRTNAAMTFDAADGYMLLVGGSGDLNQTWALSNETVYISPIVGLSLSASPNPTDLDVPVNVSVAIAGGRAPFSYEWTNSTGNFTTSTNWTTQQFDAPGSYLVGVAVTDSDSTHRTASISIVVNSSITNSFTFADIQTVGVAETFSGIVSDGVGPYQYAWNFGDGTFSATPGGTHVYTRPGSYNVTFATTDSLGQQTNTSESVTVAPAITASLSVTNSTPSIEQSVLFNVTATGGLGPFTYAWSGLPVGCASVNSSSIGCAPTQSGTYVVTVDVTDAFPGVANATVDLSVIFEFTLTVTTLTPEVGQNVTLGVQSSTPSADLSYSYTGLPPGCVSANVPELTCTPSAAGTYNVTVTVTDVAADVSTSRTILLDVVAGAVTVTPHGGNSTPSSSYIEPLAIGVGVGAAVAASIFGIWAYRQRRRTPPSESK